MNIPKITPVILRHHIKKDGTASVKIRITHNRKVKYIPTNEVATKKDYTKDLIIKDAALIVRLSKLTDKIENAIKELDVFELDKLDLDAIMNHVDKTLTNKEVFLLDFFEWGEKVAASKPKYSAANYRTALRSFSKYLEKDKLDISELTSSMMRSYEDHLVEKHGQNARAVSLYTSAIASIHTAARKKYNNEELDQVRIKNPFEYYKPAPQKPAPKYSIGKETVQKLIDIRGQLGEMHKLAVDVFLLSFCMMGTNVPDLHEATREKDIIYYNRMKTRERRHDKAAMQIRLEPVCKCIFDDMLDPTGERAFKLHHQYSFYKSIADKANDRLKEVATILGVKPFSMKAARHTWPTIAYSIAIPESLINDCMCHVDNNMRVTDIYIDKDWSVLWEANKKVLEQFTWK